MALYTFLQILSVTAFEKVSILQVLRDLFDTEQPDGSVNSWNYSRYDGTLVRQSPFSHNYRRK